MPILTVSDTTHRVPDLPAHKPVIRLDDPSIHEELDAMVASVGQLDYQIPDHVMMTTMAYMARLTELWMFASRMEHRHRHAKLLKNQVQKVMDLMDFEFKAASRVLESMKFELETSK